jgi:hypothetical protein
MQLSNINHGIILKIKIDEPYALIFDQQRGKMRVYHDFNRSKKYLTHGSLVQYSYKKASTLKVDDIIITMQPAAWIGEDLLFFHHILEMAVFFLPEHEPAPVLFEHFQLLYQPHRGTKQLFKKLFMCRFFSLLGIYPENALTHYHDLFHLISRPINIMLNAQDDYVLQASAMTPWLLACIQTHPHAQRVQTINFLTNMDQHET